MGVAVAVLALLSITTCNPTLPDPLPVTPVAQTNASNLAPQAAPVAQVLPGLTGRWQRPDGGYVLEVKAVASDGRLTAAYYNPRSINVARAEAAPSDQGARVFIELRDEGYPGSTYTLAYLPDRDVLVGKYYQAALQQEFDVAFTRVAR